MAPAVAERAGAVHDVAPGRVDELAGELLAYRRRRAARRARRRPRHRHRQGDSGAARPTTQRPRVAAIPTTLSAAEMTRVHRRAAGADGSLPGVRPALVVNDPRLSASQPAVELAASAANALAHAVEGPATRNASPLPALAGGEAARLIGAAYAARRGRARSRRCSRSRRCCRATRSTAPATACTTCSRRRSRASRASGTAAPTPSCCRTRSSRWSAAGRRRGRTVALATELARRAQATSLRELGVDEQTLDACADTAAGRAELDLIPPRPDRDELRALYAAAF